MLIWAISILGIADLFVLAGLLVHHSISTRSRNRISESKNLWFLSLQNIVKTGGYDTLKIENAGDYLVIAETLSLFSKLTPQETARLRTALEHIGYVDHYLRRLASRWWWVRAEATFALGQTDNEKVLIPLINALSDEAISVRLKAATALAELGNQAAINAIADNLNSLGYVGVEWLKDIFYQILQDKPEILNDLLFTIDNPLIKKSLIEVSGLIEKTDSAPLLSLISNESAELELRISAVKSLGVRKTKISGFEKVLRCPEWQLRAVAAKVAGEIGDTFLVPTLGALLGDPNWWVRVNSAYSLQRLGKPGLRELERNLEVEDVFARDIAQQVLSDGKMTKEGISRG